MRAGSEILTNVNRFFTKWLQLGNLLNAESKLPEHLKPTNITKVHYSSFLNQICCAYSNPVLLCWVTYYSVEVLN